MSYSRAQASRLAQVSPQRLVAWERRGLLAGNYDFQELRRARELARLASHGVRPQRLSTRSAVGVLDGLPIWCDQAGLCLPDGQGVLDFREPPAPPGAHPLAASYWLEQGEYARALELDPTLVEAWHRLGLESLAQGRAEEAEACWKRVVDFRPYDPRARYNLALAQEDCGRLEEAALSLHHAIALDSQYQAAHFNLARLYELLGRRARARWHWQAAASSEPLPSSP